MTQGCDGKAAVKDDVERPELASVSPEPPQWHQLVQAPTPFPFEPPQRHQLVKKKIFQAPTTREISFKPPQTASIGKIHSVREKFFQAPTTREIREITSRHSCQTLVEKMILGHQGSENLGTICPGLKSTSFEF